MTVWKLFVDGRKIFSGSYDKCFDYVRSKGLRVTFENHTTHEMDVVR
jgi:hypothetical protein